MAKFNSLSEALSSAANFDVMGESNCGSKNEGETRPDVKYNPEQDKNPYLGRARQLNDIGKITDNTDLDGRDYKFKKYHFTPDPGRAGQSVDRYLRSRQRIDKDSLSRIPTADLPGAAQTAEGRNNLRRAEDLRNELERRQGKK